jgi:hypothetical protein
VSPNVAGNETGTGTTISSLHLSYAGACAYDRTGALVEGTIRLLKTLEGSFEI